MPATRLKECILTVEYVEKVYNRQASFYDHIFGRPFPGRERAIQLLELFPGSKVLEVGVGTGLTFPSLPRNVNLTGIDLSRKMLAKAEKRIESLGLHNVRLMRMDASRLQFPDHSFDRVLAAYFISTVADPVAIVEEMKRVCRPGGYLVMMNHFLSENPIKAFFERICSPLFYRIGFRTDLDLQRLLRDCHLEANLVENTDLLGHWKTVRCINP